MRCSDKRAGGTAHKFGRVVNCVWCGRSLWSDEVVAISASSLIKENGDEAYWKRLLPIIGARSWVAIRFTHRLPRGRGRAGSAWL
jgi:hypothetical protein